MDFTPVITQVWSMFAWIILPLVLIVGIFKSSWFKGILGEWLVSWVARRRLDKHVYRAVHNVTLKILT